MRTVQEIFEVVIDNGFYAAKYIKDTSSPVMCYALLYAKGAGMITHPEYASAFEEVKGYIGGTGCPTLKMALDASNMKSDFNDLLMIYLDWEFRPELHKPQDMLW